MYKFFSQQEDVSAGMSTKNDGNMKIKGNHSTSEAIENRKKFCKQNDIRYENVVNACVEHTTNIVVVDENSNRNMDKTDALVTSKKNVYLSVTSADCYPVFLYDDHNEVIGIVHAGWRGIVKDIVPKTLNVMLEEGAQIERIKVTIGPGISKKYFNFGFEELISEFGFYNQDKYVIKGSTFDKVKINLRQIIFDQSESFGVNKDNVHDCGVCTFADESNFYSARRDGADFNVMMSIIGMK